MNSGSLMPRPTLPRRRVAPSFVAARTDEPRNRDAGRGVKTEAAVILETDSTNQ